MTPFLSSFAVRTRGYFRIPNRWFATASSRDSSISHKNTSSYTEKKIGLPMSRVVYTVNRSPHIDKKSREQFEMRIHKKLTVIKATEKDELRKMFFWLKRQHIFGAQYEVQIHSKTRLGAAALTTSPPSALTTAQPYHPGFLVIRTSTVSSL